MVSSRLARIAASTATAVLLGLCAAAAARAQGPSSPLRVERAPLASSLPDALRIDRADFTGVIPLLWVALSPVAPLFSRLGLFAGSREVSERRQPSAYEVEGGALLRMFEGISLTGGYRITGYHTETSESAARDDASAGPFIALRWHF